MKGDALKQHVDSDERKALTYKAFGDLAQSLWKGNDFSVRRQKEQWFK